uniref:Uncharacterized protein n=1 Tax=Haemonchus contortus TaxID=6289 RepID=A0A7I4XYY3_HAECO
MTQTPPSVVRSYHPPLLIPPASSTPTEFELSGFTETGVMIFRGNICFAQIPPLWAESGPVTLPILPLVLLPSLNVLVQGGRCYEFLYKQADRQTDRRTDGRTDRQTRALYIK